MTVGTEDTRATLRDGGLPLLALLGLALALKLWAVFAAVESNPLTTDLTSDSLYYMDRARGLAGEWDDPLADEPHHLPPLYPVVLAITGTSVTAVLVLQALAGTALLAMLWLVARRRLSRTAALTAVGLTLAYGPLTFFETKVLGDSLATALLVAVILAGDRVADAATKGGRLKAAGVMGALVSLCALLRPQALLLVPLLGAWLLGGASARAPGGRTAVVPFVLAAALLLVPSTLHNMSAGAGLIPVSDNGGVNLWIANTGPVSGTFVTENPAFGDIASQSRAAATVAADLARADPSSDVLDDGVLTSAEVGHVLGRAALDAIADDPGTFLQRVGRRALALLESFETGIVTVPQVEMEPLRPLPLSPIPFGLLLACCAAAWALGGCRRMRERATCGPTIAVGVMVVVTTLLFFHYSRFRLPLAVILALGCGAGLDVVLAGRPPMPRVILAAVLWLGAAAVTLLPAPHHAPALAGGHATLGESYLRGALASGDGGLLVEAEREAAAALDAQPGFLRAELLAAHAFLLQQKYREAAGHLHGIETRLPDYVPMLVLKARLLTERHAFNPFADREAAAALLNRLRRLPLDDWQLSQIAELQQQLPLDGGPDG